MDRNEAVVVTGAVGGLGTAICRRLARDGRTVVACDRRAALAPAWLEALAAEERARVRFLPLDVSREDDVGAFTARLAADGLRVSRLVNNAGIQGMTPVGEVDPKTWDRVLRVNLWGTMHLTRAFAPGMVERRFGRIVNFASLYAYHPGEGQSPYAAAKAGIVGFTHATALELAPHGVTANVIAPGLIYHEGLKDLMGPLGLEGFERRIPMGRFGRPDEIAATIAFLISDEASYLTGQTIHVNGGAYLPG